MVLEQLDIHVQKKFFLNLQIDLTPFTKMNSKWITDLHKCKTQNYKLKKKKKTGGNLNDLALTAF